MVLMSSPLLLVLIFVLAYLIGAIPFGYLIARSRGVDIFAAGSGNIGATNVGRVLGRGFGLLVFVLDLGKGAVPVLLTRLLVSDPADLPADSTVVTAGIGAFLGHLFPVYLGFRGGKGVATGAGVLLVLLPGPFLLAAVLWLAVFATTRTVSLASLLAAGFLGGYRPLWLAAPWDASHVVVTGFCLLATLLVVIRHHANLGRLLRGTENAFPESPTMTLLGKVLHVLSVGLWFGTVVCFTAVGLSLFSTMDGLSEKPYLERANYFPIPETWKVWQDRPAPSARFPDPVIKEQGRRIAGDILSPMFPWFFGTQVFCGVIALATALLWYGSKVGQLRVLVALFALGLAVVGWGLEVQISGLRGPRNEATNLVLATPRPTEALINAADEHRARFALWHVISDVVNLLTLVLVVPLMGLCAALPAGGATPVPTPTPTPAPATHTPVPISEDNGEQTVVIQAGEETRKG
jgi:acyl-phosphate glycerol 3-phosphate acyltransferase